MTVVVGILNKRGVSIAADSATTHAVTHKLPNGDEVVDGFKIMNSGNKMLRLSDTMPVGIMIVNVAYILNIPWDVIIRWYRKKRGHLKFETVQDIATDFLDFVPEQNFFSGNSLSMKWNRETELVFAGYGTYQKYPQLVYVKITGVSDNKLKYDPQEIQVCSISDEHESDIVYYGQKDITAMLTDDFGKKEEINDICNRVNNFFMRKKMEFVDKGLIDETAECIPNFEKLIEEAYKERHQFMRQQWLDTVKDYSLQKMAGLAETLIRATELYQNIMFQDETVGGLIDLAVITREDGFQWLNRKSWYEPSKGGQYGKFGI